MNTVQKPWGSYTDLKRTSDYVVKEIIIQPGEGISLQSHNNRSEIWTIISGTGNFINGSSINNLKSNTVTHGTVIKIDTAELHRITCISSDPLKFIEVQIGSCDESDIIRYEDKYGRI